MAFTETYVGLDSVTLGSDTAYVDFTSIPGTYTDLVITANVQLDTSTQSLLYRFNGDTANNYSLRIMKSSSTTQTGELRNSVNYQLAGGWDVGAPTSTYFAPYEIHIGNYASTNMYKSSICKGGWYSDNSIVQNMWFKSTSEAITSIRLYAGGSGNLKAGSQFALYGIARQANVTGTAKATGGTIYYDSYGYVYHRFTSSGTFTPSSNISSLEALIVAGGGGGGMIYGGGGGAGGVVYGTLANVSTARTVTVGGGGSYQSGGVYSSVDSTNGVDSSVTGFTTAVGGGRGYYSFAGGNSNGADGGSGGGVGNPGGTAGVGTRGQGFAGGFYISGGGGGGGAGEIGSTDSYVDGGDGTIAFAGWASVTGSGSNYFYAGGGGGGNGTGQTAGVGGLGGGANGGAGTGSGSSGSTNTGGGGGGGGYNTGGSYGISGSGGSGIVILRYLGA